MPSTGFEPATPTTKRAQTYVLDRAATEVGCTLKLRIQNSTLYSKMETRCYAMTLWVWLSLSQPSFASLLKSLALQHLYHLPTHPSPFLYSSFDLR
jgi:hypothetical protein